MKHLKIFFTGLIFTLLGTQAFASNVWLNDLRSLYLSKQAVIYEINIRTFNAKDLDGNGIIGLKEEKGNFLNATKRLNELADAGINTIKILPVLPVGKIHATGTAGSLFAPVEFDKINPQLKSSRASVYEDMRKFINDCHKRKIRVIVELPCCAGYDLYTKKPNLFIKDSSGKPISPNGYSDILILNAGTENSINGDVYKLYSDFTKMMLDLSVDGISVSMPETKPYAFWKKLIDETRKYDSEILFIAETNPNSAEIFKNAVPVLPKNKILDAGFDGYTENYDTIENTKTEFYNLAKSDISVSLKYDNKKAVTANISSYENVTPVVRKGTDFSKQLLWITSALPVNVSYSDGFSTADNYMYALSNKKAYSSLTDDKFYSMKRGQPDIYNFSRKPEGSDFKLYAEFVTANKFRAYAQETLSKGNFVQLKTNNPNIIAFARSYNSTSVIVIANTEKSEFENIKIKVPRIKQELFAIPIKVSESIPSINNGEIVTNLSPLETQVIMFQSLDIK